MLEAIEGTFGLFMSLPLAVLTTRLELIAATAETVSLELHNIEQFATALGVPVPSSWPPPLNDEGSQRWYLEMLQRHPSAVGWGLWYLIRREPTRELVGVAGFKGRPADGSCEIGYSLVPSFHGSGYATEASRELIRWALSHGDVERVTSETLPDLIDSIRVMEKCGMRFIGDGNPKKGNAPSVTRWIAPRSGIADLQNSRFHLFHLYTTPGVFGALSSERSPRHLSFWLLST